MLDHPHKAEEISQGMQSAFRVLSLTKPDQAILIRTLLKCEGFRNYKELSGQIVSFLD